MREFYLGLGSNLGDRMAFLAAAVEALSSVEGIALEQISGVYETAPVGGVPQGDYLNLVVGGRTALTPEALLAVCLGVEAKLGRVRKERWGPRQIDIDLLWFEGAALTTEALTLPHPRMADRAFVMVPLAEIAPGLPVAGTTAYACAASLDPAGVRLFSKRLSTGAPKRMLVRELPYEGGVERIFKAWHVRRGAVWLDSALEAGGLGRYSMIGCEPELEFVGQVDGGWIRHAERDRFETGQPWEILSRLATSRKRQTATTFPFRSGMIGYASYESGLSFENLTPSSPPNEAPLMRWGFYDRLVVEDRLAKRLFAVVDPVHSEESEALAETFLADILAVRASDFEPEVYVPQGGAVETSLNRAEYADRLARVKAYIASGDVYQVNLARRYRARLGDGGAFALYRRLRELSPAPYSAYLHFEDDDFVCSSPERFLSVTGRVVTTRPIKGTRPRGRTPGEDEANRRDLQNSEKDRAELLMIVDLERNDLGRVCDAGTVVVSDLFRLETFPSVHHLVADVTGRLGEGRDVFDLLRASFPGGSITGAPKVRAMQIIDELEPVSRGIYTGAAGYIGFDGNAVLNIAIRTIHCRDGVASFHAGSGIVWDSKLEEEFDEVHAKARALLVAVTGEAHQEAVP